MNSAVHFGDDQIMHDYSSTEAYLYVYKYVMVITETPPKVPIGAGKIANDNEFEKLLSCMEAGCKRFIARWRLHAYRLGWR